MVHSEVVDIHGHTKFTFLKYPTLLEWTFVFVFLEWINSSDGGSKATQDACDEIMSWEMTGLHHPSSMDDGGVGG